MYGPDAFPPVDDKTTHRTTSHPSYGSPTSTQSTLPETHSTSSNYLAFAAGTLVGSSAVLLSRPSRFNVKRAARIAQKKEFGAVDKRFDAYRADPHTKPLSSSFYNSRTHSLYPRPTGPQNSLTSEDRGSTALCDNEDDVRDWVVRSSVREMQDEREDRKREERERERSRTSEKARDEKRGEVERGEMRARV